MKNQGNKSSSVDIKQQKKVKLENSSVKPQYNKKEGKSFQKPNNKFQKKISDKKSDKIRKYKDNKIEQVKSQPDDQNKDVQIDQLVMSLSKEYSKLLIKDDSLADQKILTIDKILKQIGPMLQKICNKRKGSKVIQACLKFGSQQQKELINKFYTKDESVLNETVKSKYGHFVLLKLIKFYPKGIKDKLFNVLKQHVISYLTQKESAAKVLDRFIIKVASPNQIQQLKSQLDTKSKEQTIENLTLKIAENQLQNYVLSQYVITKGFPILIPAEKEQIVEALIPSLQDFSSKDGLKLAINVINFANSKQRKIIVKNYKDKVLSILQNEQSKGFLIIQKLLFSVDDTKILDKFIIKEITQNIQQVVESKNGLILLQNIYFQQEKQNIDELFKIEQSNIQRFFLNNKSKKDFITRKNEIISPINQDMIKYLQNNLKVSLENSVLSKFINYHIENDQNAQELISNIILLFIDDFKNNKIDQTLFTHGTAHRMLKQIIISQEKNNNLQDQIEKIFQIVNQNLKKLLDTKAVFIIIALIEHSKHSQKLIGEIKKISDLGNQTGQEILKQIINK